MPYPDAITLMHELRAMGESNAATHRRGWLSRETMLAAAAVAALFSRAVTQQVDGAPHRI